MYGRTARGFVLFKRILLQISAVVQGFKKILNGGDTHIDALLFQRSIKFMESEAILLKVDHFEDFFANRGAYKFLYAGREFAHIPNLTSARPA